jgi:hypothetical protein
VLAVLALPVVVGCSAAPTPLCDRAAGLTEARRLTAALAQYLEAERQGEGGCADDGKRRVQDEQAQVAQLLARAATAEQRDASAQARQLYVQALTRDVDNDQARAGIARLQTDEPAPTATPTPTVRPAASQDSGTDPLVVVVLTVLLFVGLATGVILSLLRGREQPARAHGGGRAWPAGGSDETDRRLERLEARVAFLAGAVEQLAGALPVPRVRFDVVPPRRGPGEGDRTTSVTAVTVIRVPDTETLLVVCRRIVNEASRPPDELVTDISTLGTPDAPTVRMLLDEASIAAATRGLLDPSWRVVQGAWQVDDPAGVHGSDAVLGQVHELLVGRPVVLPATVGGLPAPLTELADQVASVVATPGDEPVDRARVLVHATSICARPPAGGALLLAAGVRSLAYDMTAAVLADALRGTLPAAADAALDADGPAPPSPGRGPADGAGAAAGAEQGVSAARPAG